MKEEDTNSALPKIAPKPSKPVSKAPLPKPRHPAFTDEFQDVPSYLDETKVKTEFETKVSALQFLNVLS